MIWHSSPWILPGFIGLTMGAVALAISFMWVELAILKVPSLEFVGATLALIGVLWLVGAMRLALVKWSNNYALRASSGTQPSSMSCSERCVGGSRARAGEAWRRTSQSLSSPARLTAVST